MRVMFDVDGILFPFQAAYGYALRGEPFADDEIVRWRELPGAWSDDERERALMASHSYDFIDRFGFYPEAIAAVAELRAAGVAVDVCTRRERSTAADLLRAMDEQGLVVDSVHCARQVNKIEWCRERGITVMVDDKPSTITAAAEAGMRVFSLEWPYNAGLHAPPRIVISRDWRVLTDGILVTCRD